MWLLLKSFPIFYGITLIISGSRQNIQFLEHFCGAPSNDIVIIAEDKNLLKVSCETHLNTFKAFYVKDTNLLHFRSNGAVGNFIPGVGKYIQFRHSQCSQS